MLCASTYFFAVITLRFTCLSIKLLWKSKHHNDTDVHRYENFSMTANLALRKTTTVVKAKVKVEFSLEKVWKWQCFDCEFLEIWEWLKITRGLLFFKVWKFCRILTALNIFTAYSILVAKFLSFIVKFFSRFRYLVSLMESWGKHTQFLIAACIKNIMYNSYQIQSESPQTCKNLVQCPNCLL